MQRILRHLFLCTLCALASVVLSAQGVVITGRVTDAETRLAIPDAIVKALRADSTHAMLTYALTDASGSYRLALKASSDCDLEFVVLGYRTVRTRVKAQSATIDRALTPETFRLKEVTVKAPPIGGHNDTITYNVAAFISKADRNVEDILRKLPGITVSSDGLIEYQGKTINKFYIEGLDMLEGRYSLATRNITPDRITSVQVYENHQPVRLLKGIDFSDRAALNIKLKNNAMTLPSGYALAGGGYGPRVLYRGELFGFMANARMQLLATLKVNNCGRDVQGETALHYGADERGANAAGQLAPVPFDIPQTVRARTHDALERTASLNTIHRAGADATLKLNVSYTRDRRDYERTATDAYLTDGDAIVVREDMTTRTADNDLSAALIYERNADSAYVKNTTGLHVRSRPSHTLVRATPDLRQDFRSERLDLANDLSLMWRRGLRVFRLQSSIAAGLLPADRLTITAADQTPRSQRVAGRSLYTRHATSIVKGFNAYANLRLDLALETEHDRIETDRTEDSLTAPAANRNHGYRLAPIVTSAYTYARGPFHLSLDLPLQYLHLRYADDVRTETFRHDRLYLNPRLSLKYTVTPALNFSLGGGLSHATGDILSFVRSPIRRSYNRVEGGASGILAHRRTANLSASYMYRHTMEGLFSSLFLRYSRTQHNVLRGINITPDGALSTLSQGATTYTDRYGADFYLAKNVHWWNTTFALNAAYTAYRSETIRQGRSLAYSGSLLSVYPTVHLRSLAWLSVRVRGIVERSTRWVDLPAANASAHLNTWGADADVSVLPFENLELFYRLDYLSLPAEGGPRVARCFMDAGVRCHPVRRVELELTVQNLTNADRYTEIRYVDADLFTTSFRLRPLHAVLTLKAAF